MRPSIPLINKSSQECRSQVKQFVISRDFSNRRNRLSDKANSFKKSSVAIRETDT